MNSDAASLAILATRGVTLARGGKTIARLPDLTVAAGQSMAIVGPSGCGKTTALMALAGIRAPQQGTITVEGTDLWTLGRGGRDGFRGRRIGLVFQSFHLIDALSVRANIWMAAQCAGYPVDDHKRLQNLMERLGLTAIQSRRADRISHGQAQRTAIARALLNRPAVILADEPTSALDDANTETLMTLLIESAVAENAGLVVTTHDRRVLDAVDTVVEMVALP
ncbi:MAG TPA: ATP-binding cassette domain-containing protein [Rhizomicrobium sp.]|nr:ATP-binding cassette domain-containing protein [Rhizomicrobium sp.]